MTQTDHNIYADVEILHDRMLVKEEHFQYAKIITGYRGMKLWRQKNALSQVQYSIGYVANMASMYFNIPVDNLRRKYGKDDRLKIRQYIYHFLNMQPPIVENKKMSITKMGAYFNCKHSTVNNALNQFYNHMETDQTYAQVYYKFQNWCFAYMQEDRILHQLKYKSR